MAPEPENELIEQERERVPDAIHALPATDDNGGELEVNGHTRIGRNGAEHEPLVVDEVTECLSDSERGLLGDLFAVVEEHAAASDEEIDRAWVERAFVFACQSHADQKRRSGEDFVSHPVEVAKICAGLRLDTETLCAALLHDTVEDTTASIDEVSQQFGDDVAHLVDGVTKLTGITFESRDESQAENYRKICLLYTSPSPRDGLLSRMPSSA